MSLKKFMASMMYKRWLHKYKSLSLNKPNRVAYEALLSNFHPDLFRDYQPEHGLTVTVKPLYKSIETYTNKLKELTRFVKEERPLPPDWSDDKLFEMRVDRFLTSADGYYLDIPKAVEQFRSAALTLTQLMKESDTATHGVYEHNLRMLTKLFINLRDVTQGLIEVSLTNE